MASHQYYQGPNPRAGDGIRRSACVYGRAERIFTVRGWTRKHGVEMINNVERKDQKNLGKPPKFGRSILHP
jgi:hypothetical protein